MSVRIDVQGQDGHDSARYHQYWIDEDWAKLHRVIPQLAILWDLPVKVTVCQVGPGAPPVSETTQDVCVFYPDGSAEDCPID